MRHPFNCLLFRSETVHFDKITSRIEKLCYGLASEYLDIPAITLKVSQWNAVQEHHDVLMILVMCLAK